MKYVLPTSSPALVTCLLALSGLGCVPSAFGQTSATDAGLEPVKNLGQIRYSTGLGRLITSERERTKIDDLRFNVIEQVKAAKEQVIEGPKLLRIEGVTQRPDRPLGERTSVWINGRVYSENELPAGLNIVRNSKGEVIGLNSVVSKGKTEFAKIGDSITRPQSAAEAQALELAAQPKKPNERP